MWIAEDSGIFGIKAEHKTNTKNIEVSEGLRAIGIILFDKRIIDSADYLAGFHRHFQLFLKMLVTSLDKELQPIVISFPLF